MRKKGVRQIVPRSGMNPVPRAYAFDLGLLNCITKIREHGRARIRIEYAGAIYHVMNRGNHQDSIFKDNVI